jgi:hypothetical protein
MVKDGAVKLIINWLYGCHNSGEGIQNVIYIPVDYCSGGK